jgi:hypothetical protein
MYLLITIDTEGDNAWAKTGHENLTKNAGFLPRFQQLCETFGYKPTYLTSYEMAKDKFFMEFASDGLKRKVCEVGLHPHPWNSPPYYQLTSDDMKLHPYLIEYPEDIIREKIKALTNLLEDGLGVKMYSHRAGRWAFNSIYAKVLCEFGYKVDCSVTPHDREVLPRRSEPEAVRVPLPDYSLFPSEAYFLGEDDISRPGNLPLLETPMTVVQNYGAVRYLMYELVPQGMSKRMFRAVMGQPVKWFRPSRRWPRALTDVAQKKIRDNAEYIMFMLHSSELMPGCNPQFRNEKEIDQLYENIQRVFRLLHEHSVTGATCFEFHNFFCQKTGGLRDVGPGTRNN